MKNCDEYYKSQVIIVVQADDDYDQTEVEVD